MASTTAGRLSASRIAFRTGFETVLSMSSTAFFSDNFATSARASGLPSLDWSTSMVPSSRSALKASYFETSANSFSSTSLTPRHQVDVAGVVKPVSVVDDKHA
jgi:hypothetical protein